MTSIVSLFSNQGYVNRHSSCILHFAEIPCSLNRLAEWIYLTGNHFEELVRPSCGEYFPCVLGLCAACRFVPVAEDLPSGCDQVDFSAC